MNVCYICVNINLFPPCANNVSVRGMGQNSQEHRDFSDQRVELVLDEGAAIPGLDEWDYWAEGSFNLGINMWTICGPSGGPSRHVT